MTEFSEDQRELWEEYASSVRGTLSSGRPKADSEVISGFGMVCLLELGEEPDETSLRLLIEGGEGLR